MLCPKYASILHRLPSAASFIPARFITHSSSRMSKIPVVLRSESIETRGMQWIGLRKIHWTDAEGSTRVWESAERTTRGSGLVDAVVILAFLRHHTLPNTPPLPTETLIVKQFRPPCGKLCIELPAGLVDKHESPDSAALRELHEETGYRGTVRHISPIAQSDPGMTSACMQLVVVDVDLDAQENVNPVAKPDHGEFIEVERVPLRKLYTRLQELYEVEGCAVDGKLLHLAYGFQFTE